MNFLRINMMSFQPINLNSIIPLHEGYHYRPRLQHSENNLHHIHDLLNILKGLTYLSFTHEKGALSQPCQDSHNLITFTHISSKEHKSTKEDTTFFHLITYSISFFKSLRMTLTIFMSTYTLIPYHQYRHHRLI